MLSTNKLSTLIVGATGQLGALITKHCLQQPNLQVNILIRNPDKDKNLVEEVEKSGGRVVVGDVTKPETLKDSTKDIHTVICALIGDDKTVVEGQKAILDDGVKNGLKRFVPSDFSLSFEKLTEEEHPFLAQRIRFKKYLETTPVKGLHVFQGVFAETFFFFHSKALHYYENPDQKLDITSYEDTARYVAAAVANPERIGNLFIHGDEVSINEVAEIYNRVKGKNLKPQNWGTIEDLKKKIEETKASGEVFKAALMAYEVPTFDGRGKFTTIHNSEFPEIKPLSFEEFIKKYPEKAVFAEN